MKSKTVTAICDRRQYEPDKFPAVKDRRYK
jgi:hypothetical protein